MTKCWICLSLTLLGACSNDDGDKTPDPIALVQTAMAHQGEIKEALPIYGATEPGNGSERTLSASAEAVVTAIAAPAGSEVRTGALIVQLRASPQAALDQMKARSDAALADAALARAGRLKSEGLVGDTEVETARATAAAADATLASLRGRAGGLAMVAPVGGVVDAVLVKPGDLVAAGAPIARIATGGAVRARFGIDPALASTIAPGSSLTISADPGAIIVPVTGVDRVVDPATRLVAVFADIPANAHLALGQPLRGMLQRPTPARGIVIPYEAVQADGGAPYVFVVKGGIANRREVTLGAQAGDSVMVLSGLVPGDRVVTRGGTALDDGMKVRTGRIAQDTGTGSGE